MCAVQSVAEVSQAYLMHINAFCEGVSTIAAMLVARFFQNFERSCQPTAIVVMILWPIDDEEL